MTIAQFFASYFGDQWKFSIRGKKSLDQEIWCWTFHLWLSCSKTCTEPHLEYWNSRETFLYFLWEISDQHPRLKLKIHGTTFSCSGGITAEQRSQIPCISRWQDAKMYPKTGIKVPKSSPSCVWATLVLEFSANIEKIFSSKRIKCWCWWIGIQQNNMDQIIKNNSANDNATQIDSKNKSQQKFTDLKC